MKGSFFELGLGGCRLEDVFVVDCHAHVGPRVQVDPDASLGTLLADMERIGIDRTVCACFPPTMGSYPYEGNDFVAEAVRRCPDRLSGYAYINPNYPELNMEELERRFGGESFSGIKVHLHGGRPYDDPLYEPIYGFAHEWGLPVLAHTWGPETVRTLGRMAERFPGARFLVGHADVCDPEVLAEEAGRAENLYFVVCSSVAGPDAVARMVEAVGAERVLWGSDTMLLSPGHQIGKVLFADLDDNVKRTILGGNARKVFRL